MAPINFVYDATQKVALKNVIKPQESDTSCCYEEPGENFKLRSRDYLTNRIKEPSAESAFDFLFILVIVHTGKLWNVAENLAPLKDFLAQHPEDFFFVCLRQVPASKNRFFNVIAVSKKKPSSGKSPFDALLESYLSSEDDAFRNQRLKYIARLDSAPWVVLTAVKALGGEKPVIMGKGYLHQRHYKGSNYYEVNVDIGSSMIARRISGTVMSFASSFIITECFVIEGQAEEELPERAIASWNLHKINLSSVGYKLIEEDLAFFKENPSPPAQA